MRTHFIAPQRVLTVLVGALLLALFTPVAPPADADTSHSAKAPAAATAVRSDTLPASTCTLTAGVRECDLWAKTGSLALPAGAVPASLPIWGYADSAGGAAATPGPLLVGSVGETLSVTLHNDLGLGIATSLSFPGQNLVPDVQGVPDGDSTTYTMELTRPGTFRYEAGLTNHGAAQVAMGMHGALVVRPASAGQAYDDPSTAFDDEAVEVISGVDLALNTSSNPVAFDMSRYQPTFWLLNGQGYPDTPDISSAPGHTVLIRYLNNGIVPASMGLMGLHERLVGQDARALSYPYDVVTETVAPGATLDALVEVPADAAPGTQYAVVEGSGRLDNGGATTGPYTHGGTVAFGGAIAFLNVVGATGPTTSSVNASPDPSNGSGDITASATITDGLTGGDVVAAAEAFVDTDLGEGAGTSLPLAAAGETTTTASGPLDVSSLTPGSHTLYVRGQDATGAWGPATAHTIRIDTSGPSVTAIAAAPDPSDGSGPVTIEATANDDNDVTAAEMYLDSACTGGTPIAMDLTSTTGSATTFTGQFATGLTEGEHTVGVRAQDEVGTWGSCATATFVVDQTGPEVSGLIAAPDSATALDSIQLTATATDPSTSSPASNIAAAEWFAGGDPGEGAASPMSAADGAFDTSAEDVEGLVNASVLGTGAHTLSVRARDEAGNWGPTASVVVTVSASDVIFADGFETGDVSSWSGSSGGKKRLKVTAAAALSGSFGLSTVINGNTPSFVRDDRPASESAANVRFWFDPNGTTTADLRSTILVGRSSGGTAVFRVQFRTLAGQPQLRAQVQRLGGTSATAWAPITDAPHAIEIDWTSGAAASATLWVDGTVSGSLSALNTSAWTLDQVRMGPSALETGMSGTAYFDGYVATQGSYVSP